MRIALGLEYAGRDLQRLAVAAGRAAACRTRSSARSREIAGRTVGTVAAGRTDAGVHATIAGRALRHRGRAPGHGVGARRQCAPAGRQVAVLWAQPVRGRVPRALRRDGAPLHLPALDRARCAPALLAGRVGWYHRPLDVAAMRAGRRARSSARTTSRRSAPRSARRSRRCKTLSRARDRARRRRACASIFRANAFLHHMIRNIVGALVYVGAGKQPPAWIGELLAARDRTRAAPTFAAGRALLHRRRLRRAAGGCRRRAARSRCRVALSADARCARCHARASRSAASLASPTALAAARAGADAIGLVFWRGTPRVVDVGTARAIAARCRRS